MKRSIQLVGALLGTMLGFGIGLWLLAQGGSVISAPNRPAFLTAFVVALLLFGYLAIPYVTTYPARRFASLLAEAEAAEFVLGVIGVIAGLIMGLLLGVPLAQLAAPWGELLPPIVAVALGVFVGWAFVYRRSVLTPALAGILPGGRKGGPTQVIVDTSAVIDGRIVDIARTGFILGTLVVPRFVLDELQRIADSSDALRRNRGRRGLEMLSALQKDGVTTVEVVEETYPDIGEVDAKLMAMARDRRAAILTNDFNLNRVAELQGIRVLNVNELANAVKVVVHPGEEMSVRIIQEGKEPGQGVGYLDDGTMIVVEGGIRFKDRQIRITVTRVLQTVAGRMIFAQPRQDAA